MEKWIKRNRLTTLWISEQRPIWKKHKMNRYEKCVCECWNEVRICRYQLTTIWRWVQSCGCLRREIWVINAEIKQWIRQRKIPRIIVSRKYHNMSETSEYVTFINIKSRCYYQKSVNYKYYGWRWIKCEWKNFEEFYRDMWNKPSKHHTIERIDNNWDYCKENCKRATMKEQSINKRNTKI